MSSEIVDLTERTHTPFEGVLLQQKEALQQALDDKDQTITELQGKMETSAYNRSKYEELKRLADQYKAGLMLSQRVIRQVETDGHHQLARQLTHITNSILGQDTVWRTTCPITMLPVEVIELKSDYPSEFINYNRELLALLQDNDLDVPF